MLFSQSARRKHEPLWTPQAPAAFGLVSFLMHAGLERNRIRKHLLVFALAAPVLAMLTFLGLSQVNVKTLQGGSRKQRASCFVCF